MGESEEKEHKNVPMAKASEFPYTVVIGEDEHFIKAQVYVKDRTQVPSGRSAYPGPRGGFYYNTKTRKPANRRPANTAGEGSNEREQHGNPQPTPPDLPGGAIQSVQISGNGVALSAALYSYGTEVQAAKTEATKKFIAWVKPQMRGVDDEDQIDKLKELAKKEGLMVREGGTHK